MLKRLGIVVLLLICTAGVISYQVTQVEPATADSRVWVPSPGFFRDFSPSFRTSIADAYYLGMVQYYGQHLTSGHLESMPAMTKLVADLSPKFKRAYFFSAFALVDAGHPDLGMQLLEQGFEANPDDWEFPALLGFFAYQYGTGLQKDLKAARWYQRAAAVPGSPMYMERLAAALLAKGGETEKAILMWGQVYSSGDEYSRERAVAHLDDLLPASKGGRMKAIAPLYATMRKAEFEQLLAELFEGYE